MMIGRWRRLFGDEPMSGRDVVAGLPSAIGGVPDGMAAGVLAGVSPIHGLYAGMAGRTFGGLSTATRLMVVTTTSATALAAGSALDDVPAEDRPGALAVMSLLAAAVMLIAAVLRLGRYTRFVSHSVMTGFLLGIAANILFGQLPGLLGAPAVGDVAVSKTVHLIGHLDQVDRRSAIVGLLALVLMLGLSRTRLRLFASLGALLAPTVLVAALSWDQVATVSDQGALPTGFPVPQWPQWDLLTPSLVGGALAITVIVLVQGAGVAESAPNPDGHRASANRDFAAQGIGNLAAGLFRGMPVGGSVGQTALNRAAGARTRWAAVWSGVWVLVIVVLCAAVVGAVPMPTLAALLIVAAVSAFDPRRLATIWVSGYVPRTAAAATFLATLLLPVSTAVGVGVALSLLLQLNQEALDLRVVRLRVDGQHLIEDEPPARLSDGEIVVLDVYGSLFYAGARTLQARLPEPDDAREPIVILRLRGRARLSATFLAVITGYARHLAMVGGHLYLSGVDPRVRRLWTDKALASHGVEIEFFPATRTIGESTLAAYADAEIRLRKE